jgi:hypothetical protein
VLVVLGRDHHDVDEVGVVEGRDQLRPVREPRVRRDVVGVGDAVTAGGPRLGDRRHAPAGPPDETGVPPSPAAGPDDPDAHRS